VPYIHTQGFRIGQNIQICMPLYEGSLHQLIERHRPDGSDILRARTGGMLSQILDALDFVHTQDPPIIRDVKPANILYQGVKFLLTDFGIAKVVDSSKTRVGTEWYMAPELLQNGDQMRRSSPGCAKSDAVSAVILAATCTW